MSGLTIVRPDMDSTSKREWRRRAIQAVQHNMILVNFGKSADAALKAVGEIAEKQLGRSRLLVFGKNRQAWKSLLAITAPFSEEAAKEAAAADAAHVLDREIVGDVVEFNAVPIEKPTHTVAKDILQ